VVDAPVLGHAIEAAVAALHQRANRVRTVSAAAKRIEVRSDFLISAENGLAHLGRLSGQFVDQSRTGFRVAESGLG
jgi:hypothetical protein